MEYVFKEYSGKVFDFPDRDINPTEKETEDYARRWAKAVYSLFVNGKTAFSADVYDYWSVLDSYAEGRQSTEKYKSWLLSNLTDNTGKTLSSYDDLSETPLGKKALREGWYDIMWDIVSPAPMIMDKIIGALADISFDINVDVADPSSIEKQEKQKWERIVAGMYKDWFQYMIDKYGIPDDNLEEVTALPKNEKEFDYIAASEGFKLNTAKAIEKLVRQAIDVESKWDDVIIKKLIWDLVVKKIAATEEYYDPETKSFKVRYIDIGNVIIQYSKEDDFNDSEYAGYFTKVNISELKQRFPEVQEEEWKRLAYKVTSRYGNASKVPQDITTKAGVIYGYDGFKVPVFNVYWIDYDSYRNLRYVSIYGRETYRRIGFDSEIPPLSDKQIARGAKQDIVFTRKRVLRHASWVINSDYIYDFGPVNMAPRNKESKPILPIHVEAIRGKSVIENLYPVFDQFALNFFRYQNTVAKMVERGYAVNIGMLLNITDGNGKKWPWLKVIDMWQQTGILPFMVSFGGDYRGGDVSPIRPIEGGLGNRLNETIASFQWCYDMIYKFSGIDLLQPRDNASGDTMAHKTSDALVPLESTMKPIVYSMMELKRNSAEGCMRRIQIGIKNSPDIRNSYSSVINEVDMSALLVAEKDGAKYGLMLVQRPDREYRERLRGYIQKALEIGRNGMPGLTFDQAMFFEEQLDSGVNLIELRQRISYQIAKNRERMKKESMEAIQAQSQGNMEAEQAKHQAQLELEKYKSDLKVREESIKNKEYGDNERMKSNYNFINSLLDMANKEKKEAKV